MAWLFPWFPKRLMSRGFGVLMRIPLPRPLRPLLLTGFANFFHIHIPDAELPLSEYPTFDAFFTRKLKEGLRPVTPAKNGIVHPVDGRLTETGVIKGNQLVQAKGWTYDLGELLGRDDRLAAYDGGSFYTYYLCPADYHRIHAATSGQLVSALHIPGLLWPVNEWSVTNIRRLFCLNERVVLNFEAPEGKWSMVLVGATNVGHMTVTLDPSIITNRWLWHAPSDRTYDPAISIAIGQEVGMFHLGSTVICVFDRHYASYHSPFN
ncbi:MAG TPA: archaetidylserine decarboxylase, partial [Bdellovibrionales bacterium]|nr:archaetidylserine decarboxylase [Bdellovibrionales bacterium]